jgi:hypothetical protein
MPMLAEQMAMPVLSASVVAVVEGSWWNRKASWLVQLRVPGPDRRHRPAIVNLGPTQVASLLDVLKNIADRGSRVQGTRSARLVERYRQPHPDVTVEYIEDTQGVFALVWLNSSGKYRYASQFDLTDLKQAITSLQIAMPRGMQLIEELKQRR